MIGAAEERENIEATNAREVTVGDEIKIMCGSPPS